MLLLILLWSALLGWGFAHTHKALSQSAGASVGVVDPVPESYQLGQQLYLENCATCHVGVPPAVFPRETWRQIIQDPQHYGTQIQPPVDPPRLLIWNYLQFFSRGLREDEAIPYRLNNSRYFKILHPKVDLPRPTRLTNCATCHPNADQFDFRSLSAEWQDAP
jgi:mono/diheme cytochrome c family protein